MLRHLRKVVLGIIWIVPVILLIILACSRGKIKNIHDGKKSFSNKTFSYEFSVKEGVFTTTGLVNKKTGEKLAVSGPDFYFRIGPAKSLGMMERNEKMECRLRNFQEITSDKCKPVCYEKIPGGERYDFCYPPLQLIISLIFTADKNSPYIHRQIAIQSFNNTQLVIEEARLLDWRVDVLTTKGGMGFPVFLDNRFFISGEAPWINSESRNNNLSFSQYPNGEINFGNSWVSEKVIIGGGGGTKTPQKILRDYIRKETLPPFFGTLYNTWCDYRKKDLTLENTVSTFSWLSDALRPYGAHVDYCVVDDGWFLTNTVYETNRKNYPSGLIDVAIAAESYGAKLGLWFAYSSMMSDRKVLERQGLETANNYYMCVGAPRYNKALRDVLTELIKNDRVSFFKHDFNYFVCNRQNHGHKAYTPQAVEANMRATADLLEFERSLNPNVVEAITTGVNLSPWWLRYAEILFLGGKDKDYDYSKPVTSKPYAEMSYRDGLIYETMRQKETFFPLYAIMTHGIFKGLLDTAGPFATDEIWSDYIMNYLGRGTGERELYVHPKNLTELQAQILGRGLVWAEKHNDLMLNSEMILGNPKKSELYGFRGYDEKGRAYVSLRNPSFIDHTIAVKDLFLTSEYYRVTYPYHMVCRAKDVPNVTIPAEGNVILETVFLKDLSVPTPINIRSTRRNVTANMLRFDVVSTPDTPENIYFYSPPQIKDLNGVHEVKKIEKRFWSARKPPTPNIQKVEIAENEGVSSNSFSAVIFVPEQAESTLYWIVKDVSVSVKLSDSHNSNSSAVFAPERNWQIVTLKLTPGTHEINCSITDSKHGVTLSDLYIRTAYHYSYAEVQMYHSLVRGQKTNDNDLPYPISQDVVKETITVFEGQKFRTAGKLLYENVDSATLTLEVFDVNGGEKYENKQLLLNNIPIALLPVSEPPISSWQVKEIPIPKEVLPTLANINNLSINDETGDNYKIRNITLTIRLKGQDQLIIQSDDHTYCNSPFWTLTEGIVIKTDGSSFLLLSE